MSKPCPLLALLYHTIPIQTDIRKCCKGGLLPREIVSGGFTGTFAGPLILQVLSITNAAQPTTRQHVTDGSILLSIRLTDGAMKSQAMEYSSVPKLRCVDSISYHHDQSSMAITEW